MSAPGALRAAWPSSDTPAEPRRGARRRSTRPATGRSTPTRRTRSRSCPRRSTSTDTHVPKLVLAGGIVGRPAGYGLQYWTSVIDYPLNVGGRPFHSWPAFIVPTFETTILFAALRRGLRHARPERPAAALPPGLQRADASRPRPATASSCASSRATRSSTRRRRGGS